VRAPLRIITLGDDALTVFCGPGEIRHRIAHTLRRTDAWLEVVPGREDVSVIFDPHAEGMEQAEARLKAELETPSDAERAEPRTHELIADFAGSAGPDLAGLVERMGAAEGDLIKQVERSVLTVDMLGFTPGFAYLTGLAPHLVAERLSSPRTLVPAGSIGLITGQIGLYALEGPGGWPLIGRVRAPLFDRGSANPFLLSPGDRVILRRAHSS
jgi:KipI family sensor histidine kinase inhibitor